MSRRFLALGLLGVLLSGTAMAQCDTRLAVIDRSDFAVNEVHFNPSSMANWGRDRLGHGVLPSGRSLSFNPGGSGGNYDVRIVWANGDTAELMRVKICEITEIIATNRGVAAR